MITHAVSPTRRGGIIAAIVIVFFHLSAFPSYSKMYFIAGSPYTYENVKHTSILLSYNEEQKALSEREILVDSEREMVSIKPYHELAIVVVCYHEFISRKSRHTFRIIDFHAPGEIKDLVATPPDNQFINGDFSLARNEDTADSYFAVTLCPLNDGMIDLSKKAIFDLWGINIATGEQRFISKIF